MFKMVEQVGPHLGFHLDPRKYKELYGFLVSNTYGFVTSSEVVFDQSDIQTKSKIAIRRAVRADRKNPAFEVCRHYGRQDVYTIASLAYQTDRPCNPFSPLDIAFNSARITIPLSKFDPNIKEIEEPYMTGVVVDYNEFGKALPRIYFAPHFVVPDTGGDLFPISDQTIQLVEKTIKPEVDFNSLVEEVLRFSTLAIQGGVNTLQWLPVYSNVVKHLPHQHSL